MHPAKATRATDDVYFSYSCRRKFIFIYKNSYQHPEALIRKVRLPILMISKINFHPITNPSTIHLRYISSLYFFLQLLYDPLNYTCLLVSPVLRGSRALLKVSECRVKSGIKMFARVLSIFRRSYMAYLKHYLRRAWLILLICDK